MKIKTVNGLNCAEENCPFNRECANHESAGDFRSEDGFTPQLRLEGEDVFCETVHQKIDDCDYQTLPQNYDNLGRGYLFVQDGVLMRSNFPHEPPSLYLPPAGGIAESLDQLLKSEGREIAIAIDRAQRWHVAVNEMLEVANLQEQSMLQAIGHPISQFLSKNFGVKG